MGGGGRGKSKVVEDRGGRARLLAAREAEDRLLREFDCGPRSQYGYYSVPGIFGCNATVYGRAGGFTV